MALDGNRWLHVPGETPSVFDVDLFSVSPMGSWVQVRKLSLHKGFTGRSIEHLFAIHPSNRLMREKSIAFAPEVGSCFLRSEEHLTKWMRERIAVLNIAEAGATIPGVGKRWKGLISDAAELPPKIDPTKRWYTVLYGCEEIPIAL